MTDTRPIGVALIGAGMIAQRHVEAINAAAPLVELKAVMSRRPERAEHLKAYWNGPAPVFTSAISDIVENPDIQMVIVATPPSVRDEIIGPSASAGKNILLEKPVARSTAEAERVVEICEAADVSLGILFQHRVRPQAKAAHNHVQSGALGRLGHVQIDVPIWREQSYYNELGRGTYARDGGGVMLTNAIHSIDLALSFTSAVTSVQAMTATSPLHQMEAEDFAIAGMQFACGAVGSLTASTAVFPHGLEKVTLHYEHGSMYLDKDALTLHWRDGRIEHETQGRGMQDGDPLTAGSHVWHQGVIEDFAQAIRDNRAPLVTGREALRSHRLITAIETSSRSGLRVEVPT